MLRVGFFFLVVGLVSGLAHGPGKENDFAGRRVLLIGIDGCRPDALRKVVEAGRAPNLGALMATGTVSWNAYTGGELNSETLQETSSGPGWTTILTGVWRDRHGVMDNRFRVQRIAEHPHVFRRLKDAVPSAWVASFCDWPEIHRNIVGASEKPGVSFVDFCYTLVSAPARKGTDYEENDAKLTEMAVEKIRTENPDAIFMYFGNVDETGHGVAHQNGRFSPENAEYLASIAVVDGHVGSLVAAVIQSFVPREVVLGLGQDPVTSIVAMMTLAALVSICSTVDSFFALSFASTFTTGSLVSFLVFGPMIDLKAIGLLLTMFRPRAIFYLFAVAALLTFLAALMLNLFL